MRWQHEHVDLDIRGVARAAFEAELFSSRALWELVTTVQHARRAYAREVHLVFKRTASGAEELAAAE